MSVILEFRIGTQDFRLDQVLSGPSDMQFELERRVPQKGWNRSCITGEIEV